MNWDEFRAVAEKREPPPPPEPANPADLRRCWELFRKIRAELPPSAGGNVGVCLGTEVSAMLTPAVWLRMTCLYILQAHGALKEWEHGPDLDDVVFQVAATFPFGGNRIDTESFREALRRRASCGL